MNKRPTSEWGARADAAGLSQLNLATLAGQHPTSVSRGLRGGWASGVPVGLRAIILAWELMTERQRVDWLIRVAELR